MKITQNIVNDNVVINLNGNLEAKEISKIRDELMYIARTVHNNIVLNMEEIKFIDSSGLGLIVSLVKQTRENGTELSVCKLSLQAQKLFDITRMTKILSIYSTEEDAISAH